jgi:phosphoribosylformylglycinamidine synthase
MWLCKRTSCRAICSKSADKPDFYQVTEFDSVISKQKHIISTTVEPFNGAATGSGGEIRDRLAGGQGSLPMAGTAVYDFVFSIRRK